MDLKDIELSGYSIFSIFIDYNENQVKNRRAGGWKPDPRIPKEAMGINDVAVFQTRNDQGHCKLSSSRFTVVKKINEITGYFIFYAIAGEPNTTDHLPIEDQEPLRIYERQIAYIVCSHGWIHNLNVFPASLGANHEDPRRCGVGTLLSELCLIDPSVNRGKVEGNEARRALEKYRNAFDMSEKYCSKLVGLQMEAKYEDSTKKAGRVYLTAAQNMGYAMLMVDRTPKRTDIFGNEIIYELTFYQTHIARIFYDQNSGNIMPCCGKDYECKANKRNWFFCGWPPLQGKKRKHEETT